MILKSEGIFLSIIIATYNRAALLPKLIRSIVSQNLAQVEIIIVDDGSTDGTEEIVNAFGKMEMQYISIQNSERGAARNVGLKYARGLYVNYFDSDDLYLPCLSALIEFIQSKGYPSAVYGDFQLVDEDGIVLHKSSKPYCSFTRNLLHNNFMACGSVFLKRDVASAFLFHEDRRLSSAEDWELWLRVHTRYIFVHFPLLVFQQVHHPQRSIVAIDPEKIELRDLYFTVLMKTNKEMVEFYGAKPIALFVADRFTFIALSWCGSNRARAYLYWKKALFTSMQVTGRKRFWVILKKLLFV